LKTHFLQICSCMRRLHECVTLCLITSYHCLVTAQVGAAVASCLVVLAHIEQYFGIFLCRLTMHLLLPVDCWCFCLSDTNNKPHLKVLQLSVYAPAEPQPKRMIDSVPVAYDLQATWQSRPLSSQTHCCIAATPLSPHR
jgi:hypothetical protein